MPRGLGRDHLVRNYSVGDSTTSHTETRRLVCVRRPLCQRGKCPNIVMLENLSEEIRGCLRHAEECARKAEEASKSKLREEFLEMKRRWLRLAHSYQFAQKLKSFRKARL